MVNMCDWKSSQLLPNHILTCLLPILGTFIPFIWIFVWPVSILLVSPVSFNSSVWFIMKFTNFSFKKSHHVTLTVGVWKYCRLLQWLLQYLSALEVCSRRGAIQIHVYLTLPYFLLTRSVWTIVSSHCSGRSVWHYGSWWPSVSNRTPTSTHLRWSPTYYMDIACVSQFTVPMNCEYFAC